MHIDEQLKEAVAQGNWAEIEKIAAMKQDKPSSATVDQALTKMLETLATIDSNSSFYKTFMKAITSLSSLEGDNQASAEVIANLLESLLKSPHSTDEYIRRLCNQQTANKPNQEAIDKALLIAMSSQKWDLVEYFAKLKGDNKPSPAAMNKVLTEIQETIATISLSHPNYYSFRDLVPSLFSFSKLNQEVIDKSLLTAVSTQKWDLIECIAELAGDNKPSSAAVNKALTEMMEIAAKISFSHPNYYLFIGAVHSLSFLEGNNQASAEVIARLFGSLVKARYDSSDVLLLCELTTPNKPNQDTVGQALLTAVLNEDWYMVRSLAALNSDNKPTNAIVDEALTKIIIPNSPPESLIEAIKKLCELDGKIRPSIATMTSLYGQALNRSNEIVNFLKSIFPDIQKAFESAVEPARYKARNESKYRATISDSTRQAYARLFTNVEKVSADLRLCQSVRSILDDYTKSNSMISRFFHGHWNRHHIDLIVEKVAELDKLLGSNTTGKNTLNKQLIEILESIDDATKERNKEGSLSRRMTYIWSKVESAEPLSNSNSL